MGALLDRYIKEIKKPNSQFNGLLPEPQFQEQKI